MIRQDSHNVTQLLTQARQGDPKAQSALVEVVYPKLKRIAERQMQRERAGHTLQATALVNEAYLELFDANTRDWEGRAHFFAYAATVMRHILVRHARDRNAKKRGGDRLRVSLTELEADGQREEDLIFLDAVLTELMEMDQRKGRLVELRFFGGLSIKEIAEVMGLSTSSVNKDLRAARGWLFHQMKNE